MGRDGWAVTALLVVAFLALLALGVGIVEDGRCRQSWASSGLATKYVPVRGCLVRTNAGLWVSEDDRQVAQ